MIALYRLYSAYPLLLGWKRRGGDPAAPTIAPVVSPPYVILDSEEIAQLDWTASNNPGGATGFGYKIWVATTSPVSTIGAADVTLGNVLSYADDRTGVPNTYYYVVRAFNDAGEGPDSNEVSIALPGEPEAPVLTGPSQVFDGALDALLEWNEITNAITYRIERSDTGVGSWSTVTSTAGLSQTVSVPASPLTSYYRVIPVNGTDGTPSNVLQIDVILPSSNTYLRPGGVDGYRRPGGTDLYLRP